MSLVKVKNEPGLVRDTNSGAILNNDQGALNAYKAQKRRVQMTNNMAKDVEDLKERMLNIEDLLLKVLENTKK
jgi:hypothetical protein